MWNCIGRVVDSRFLTVDSKEVVGKLPSLRHTCLQNYCPKFIVSLSDALSIPSRQEAVRIDRIFAIVTAPPIRLNFNPDSTNFATLDALIQLLCLRTSYNINAAAVATFNDSTVADIGILTWSLANATKSALNPAPSLPSKISVGDRKSTSQ